MLLALELSGSCNTAALWHPAGVKEIDFSNQRGRGLLQAVESLLAANDAKKTDLCAIIVGLGPGSYTGLRIACSAGIMLSYALDIPCAGIASFDAAAFAQNLQGKTLHLLQNAYRKELYYAAYIRRGDALETVRRPQVIAQDIAANHIGNELLLGDSTFAPTAQQQSEHCQATAKDLLHLAQAFGVQINGQGISALCPVEPLYLRPAAFPPHRLK